MMAVAGASEGQKVIQVKYQANSVKRVPRKAIVKKFTLNIGILK